MWHVFTAEQIEYCERRQLHDENEVVLGTGFKLIEEVLSADLDPFQRDLLAALERRVD
jgi:hypothetical protein